MIVYRVTPKIYDSDLAGTGAKLFGGRWNPPGTPALYTSPSVALAAMETLVHASKTVLSNTNFSRVDIYFPDNVSIIEVDINTLPTDWMTSPPLNITALIGYNWATRCSSLILRVPSAALKGHEFNYIINPSHPDIKHVKIRGTLPFKFDERFKLNI